MVPNFSVALCRFSDEKMASFGLDWKGIHFITGGAGFNKDNTKAIMEKTGAKAFR